MTINLLWADQIKECRAIEADVADGVDAETAYQRIATGMGAVFHAPAALIERQSGRWRLAASIGEVPEVRAMVAAFRGAETADNDRVLAMAIDSRPWTGLMLRDPGEPALVLFAHGDWSAARPLLSDCASRLAAALRRAAAPSPQIIRRRIAAALSLPVSLARLSDPTAMLQCIADVSAKALGARTASVALHDADDDSLVVAATHGYPLALVRHLRMRPGSGIIGSVYRSGRPLCLADVRRHRSAAPPRRRYETRSCVAVPILGESAVLGVISVTDRTDARAFDRRDLRTLRRIAAVASLAVQRVAAERQARASARDAAVDALTGLFNRSHFQRRLDEEVERCRRQRSPLTLIMIDIDNLKQVNDRLGHPAGDAVLRLVGDVLLRLLRVFDVCARLGGDEFAVLMPGSGAEEGQLIAERIRAGIEGLRPTNGIWVNDLGVTASIGMAVFDGTTADVLGARADQALYAAKGAGRNRVRVGVGAPAGA